MQNQTPDSPDDDSTELANTKAWLAVSRLADADDADTYDGAAVGEAREHLEAASEAAPRGSTPAVRIDAAREDLDEAADSDKVGERRMKVRDALAELAPVAAGVADHERRDAETDAGTDTATADAAPLAVAVSARETLQTNRPRRS
jgi:hypothetical protein